MPERPASGRAQGDERMKRRRGYAALLSPSRSGAMGMPATTANAGGAAPTLGA